MISDRHTCEHPLRYKLANDVRDYCPDCGQFLYNYFIGVDPAMGKDHMVIAKIHSDGRIEILK